MGLSIQTFSLLLALGSVGGMIWVMQGVAFELRAQRFNAGLGALVGSLLGGRAAYVVIHWAYFQIQPVEIIQFWQGGLTWAGALAGGLGGLLLVSLWQRQPLGETLDDLWPLFIRLGTLAWLGCWLEGLAYGPRTVAWWGLPAINEWGQIEQRLPLQLLGAVFSLALIWGHERLPARLTESVPGLAGSLGLAGLALLMLSASLLRADPAPVWRGLRLESWAAIGFLGLAIAAILVGVFSKRRDDA
jgi:prolipoprotein diacylglyceryltransferase